MANIKRVIDVEDARLIRLLIAERVSMRLDIRRREAEVKALKEDIKNISDKAIAKKFSLSKQDLDCYLYRLRYNKEE